MVLVVKCLICQKELTYSQSNPVELIEHMKLDHPFSKKSKQSVNDKVDRETSTFHNNSDILYNLIDKSVQTDKSNTAMASGSSQERFTSRKFNNTRLSSGSEDDEKYDSTKNSWEKKEASYDKPSTSKAKTTPENSRNRINGHFDEEVSDERQQLLKDKRSKKFYKTSIERWRPVGDSRINCPRCQSFKRPTVRTQRQHVTNSSIVSTFLMTCWPLCFSPCYLPEPKYENLYCPVCNYHLGVFDHQKKIVISNPNLVQE